MFMWQLLKTEMLCKNTSFTCNASIYSTYKRKILSPLPDKVHGICCDTTAQIAVLEKLVYILAAYHLILTNIRSNV